MLNADIGADKAIDRWNAELAFRAVAEATADTAGLEFLRQLVKNLADSLGVAYAFVAEFAGTEDRVKTVAFWSVDGWRDNVEYRLSGTPCQRVVAGDLCLYHDGVQQLFPEDADLVALGARSYLGVPLRGANGRTLGHLAALDTAPMSEDPRGVTIFQVFANRARVELERLHAEAVLQRALGDLEVRLETTRRDLSVTQQSLDFAYGELQALLEINQSSARHLRREDLFAELARSVKPLLPCERFGIEVPTGPETLRVHVLALDQPARGPMIEEFPSAGTACRWAQEHRRWYVAGTREELRERFPMTHVVMEREGMESLCAVPLLRKDRSFGALFFMSTRRDAYRGTPLKLIERVASAVAVAVDNCFAYEELGRLRDRLAAENVYLKEEIQQDHNFTELVGRSPALAKVLALVETVAATDSSVLILGETGTGKELIARAIHSRSPRRARPLIKVNCAALPSGLVESELFGHEKGAFTGATERRVGRFELADRGTIFLDEVGDLPADTQVKLLRVLQEQEFERVGGSRTIRIDVRVIAATNRDLAAAVAADKFRQDLYYRLNVFPLHLPALRERSEDVSLLVHYFVRRYATKIGRQITHVSAEAMQRLAAYPWPGNVRELENVIERAVILSPGPELNLPPEVLPLPLATLARPDAARANGAALQQVEREYILSVLKQTGWRVEGPEGAAEVLGLHPNTLRSRMKKLGIRRSHEDAS